MKASIKLYEKVLTVAVALSIAIGFSSCSKSSTDVAPAYFKAGQAISDTTTGGTLKGTMLTGKTYRIKRDIVVNPEDTLVIQPGVKLYFGATPVGKNAISVIVHGSLLSL